VAIAKPLEIDESRDGERGRLTLTGELDIATAPRLEEAVTAMVGAGVKRLVIDLRPMSFMDSSGLRLFIVLCDRARADGWTLELIRPLSPALTIFQITRAEENLPFVEDAS
jgi:anti-sigma B factor antagonist